MYHISLKTKLKFCSLHISFRHTSMNMDNTTIVGKPSGIEYMTKANFILICCLNVPVAIFGIFGNIFTLAMLVRKVIPGTNSLRLKLIHLTIADLVLVIVMAMMNGVQMNSYLNPVDGTQLLRMFMPYVMRSTVYMPYSISAYLVMFIAVERVIAIVKPFKVKTYCKYEFVKVKICVCYVVGLVVCILKATEFKLVYDLDKSKYVLQMSEVGKQRSLMEFLEIFVVVVYYVIPILATLVCNIVFVVSLLYHRRKMARIVADVNNTTMNNKAKSKTEGMIILLTLLFFVTIAPSAIMRTYVVATGTNLSKSVRMGMTLMQLLLTANHCLNPIVYTVTVSGYRQRLIQLVTFNRKGQEVSSTS